MVSFTQPLIVFCLWRSFHHDRYDDVPPVCGILWFWLLLRLICHCNRLDLHATFVGILRDGGWREVGPDNFPLEIHAARDLKSNGPWKCIHIRLQV